MYSESIVNERLEIATSELGYPLIYHSVDEVDRFINHIESFMRLDANNKPYLSRDLTADEYRFIENERILCACDAAYFLTRYAFLSDENNNAVRFKFRGAQPIYFSVISELEAQRAAIELIIGKARQQYITTITQLLVLHRVLFHNYTYGVVASADASKSAEMAEKAFFTYDALPWWLKPKYSRRVEGVPGLLKFDGTMKSRLSILHGSTAAKVKGGQKVGIARGSTPTVYGISEVAHFPDAEQTIEAALFGGVHANPKILGVLESTFAGDRDWFAKSYKHAKENFATGMSRLRALFFSWPCAREIYPTPTWWRTHRQHVPANWNPQYCQCGCNAGKVSEQINKSELFIRSSQLFAPHVFHTPSCPANTTHCSCPLGRDWIMPIEQRWFYHFRYTQAERNGTLGTLMQELSCDDIEAMVSSFDNVFGREVIEIISDKREKQFDVYGIIGQGIDDRFEPDPSMIDYTKPRTLLRHRTPKNENYSWELIPLRYDLFAKFGELEDGGGAKNDIGDRELGDCKLFVYKQPLPNRRYGIGGDSASGSGSDASTLSVNLVGHDGLPDAQAASFRSHLVNHVELYAFLMPIALYFRDPAQELHGWPELAIEQIASVGDVCQSEVRKMGYPVGRIFNFGRYDTKELKAETNKLGWFTTGWSRPILLGHFVHAVQKGWYIVNDPVTIEECRQFEVHSTSGGKQKLEHSSESWDDGIFASAISYFIMHDLESLAARTKDQYRGNRADDQLLLPPLAGIDGFGRPLSSGGVLVNPDLKPLSLDELVHTMSQSNPFRR